MAAMTTTMQGLYKAGETPPRGSRGHQQRSRPVLSSSMASNATPARFRSASGLLLSKSASSPALGRNPAGSPVGFRRKASLEASQGLKTALQSEEVPAPPVQTQADLKLRYTDGAAIRDLLQDGSVALVKGSWLVQHSQVEGALIPRRQDMPPEAFWDAEELMVANNVRRGYEIVAISHCWMSPEHPDPQGDQLRTLGQFIEAWSDSLPGLLPSRVALFFDWCSLHQEPRSREEEDLFKRAVESSELWFAHKVTYVWQLTKVRNEMTPYHSRGWPIFEEACSAIWAWVPAQLLDLAMVQFGAHCPRGQEATRTCATKRRPPLAPHALAKALAGCQFSRPADLEVLLACYEMAFRAVTGSFERLDFRGLGWGDAEASVLSESLPYFFRLKELDLFNNEIGDFGAAALAEAVPKCRSLKRLCLDENEIELGLEGPERLRAAWQGAGKDLRELWLSSSQKFIMRTKDDP